MKRPWNVMLGGRHHWATFIAILSLFAKEAHTRAEPNAKFAVLGEGDPCSAHCSRCPKYDLL